GPVELLLRDETGRLQRPQLIRLQEPREHLGDDQRDLRGEERHDRGGEPARAAQRLSRWEHAGTVADIGYRDNGLATFRGSRRWERPGGQGGMQMDSWVWIVIVAAVVIVIALVAWAIANKRRTDALRGRFGPEYDRALRSDGSRREAESDLRERVDRHEALDIKPLDPNTAVRYRQEW